MLSIMVEDILKKIFSYLNYSLLLILRSVSKQFKRVASSDILWRKFALKYLKDNYYDVPASIDSVNDVFRLFRNSKIYCRKIKTTYHILHIELKKDLYRLKQLNSNVIYETHTSRHLHQEQNMMMSYFFMSPVVDGKGLDYCISYLLCKFGFGSSGKKNELRKKIDLNKKHLEKLESQYGDFEDTLENKIMPGNLRRNLS